MADELSRPSRFQRSGRCCGTCAPAWRRRGWRRNAGAHRRAPDSRRPGPCRPGSLHPPRRPAPAAGGRRARRPRCGRPAGRSAAAPSASAARNVSTVYSVGPYRLCDRAGTARSWRHRLAWLAADQTRLGWRGACSIAAAQHLRQEGRRQVHRVERRRTSAPGRASRRPRRRRTVLVVQQPTAQPGRVEGEGMVWCARGPDGARARRPAPGGDGVLVRGEHQQRRGFITPGRRLPEVKMTQATESAVSGAARSSASRLCAWPASWRTARRRPYPAGNAGGVRPRSRCGSAADRVGVLAHHRHALGRVVEVQRQQVALLFRMASMASTVPPSAARQRHHRPARRRARSAGGSAATRPRQNCSSAPLASAVASGRSAARSVSRSSTLHTFAGVTAAPVDHWSRRPARRSTSGTIGRPFVPVAPASCPTCGRCVARARQLGCLVARGVGAQFDGDLRLHRRQAELQVYYGPVARWWVIRRRRSRAHSRTACS